MHPNARRSARVKCWPDFSGSWTGQHGGAYTGAQRRADPARWRPIGWMRARSFSIATRLTGGWLAAFCGSIEPAVPTLL